ncbi:MAG: hypothetical protein JNG88_13390 [Phycisphaerales bacterium]|nr:hypothetical protein [Phycisphaerales bacterium]
MNNFDIDAFVLAVADPEEFETEYPGCDILNCDKNGDGLVNNFDLDPFGNVLVDPATGPVVLMNFDWDAENRLVGVWYDGGDTAVSGQRVARYEYDGLFRRIEKELSNQGDGIVYGSNPSGITGIQGGDRFERYYYAGWRVVELRDNYSSPNRTLGQFVYGTNTSTSRWPTTATPTRRRAARRIMIVWIRAGRSAMCTIRM